MFKLKKILLIMFVLIFSVSMIAAASPKATYDSAFEALVSRDYATAADLFGSCSFYEDANDWAMYAKAKLIAENGDHAYAAQIFDELDYFADSYYLSRYCLAYALAFESGEDSAKIRRGAGIFDEIGSFSDSYELAAKAYDCADAVDFANAQKLLAEGKYQEAYELFLSISEYQDSASKAEEALLLWNYSVAESLENKRDYYNAYLAFTALGEFFDSAERAASCYEKYCAAEYAKAERLERNGDYQKAYETFLAISGYKDSESRAEAALITANYNSACALENDGKYFEAYKAFKALGAFKDSPECAERCLEKEYVRADKLENKENFSEAYFAFQNIAAYKDSKTRAEAIKEKAYYQAGTEAIHKGSFEDAAEYFGTISYYEDSETKRYLSFNLSFADEVCQLSPEIVTYCFEGEWGLINFEKNILIHPTWQEYESVADDMLVISKNGFYGMVNTEGTVVIPPAWTDYEQLSNSIAFTEYTSDGKALKGVASREGEIVFEPSWNALHAVSDKLAIAENDSKKAGVIDLSGKVLTECKWDAISEELVEGDLILCKNAGEDKNEFYLMDSAGKLLNREPFFALGSSGKMEDAKFSDGWMLCVDDTGCYGFISPEGNRIDAIYEDAYAFSNERAAVCLNGFWGYLDTNGTMVIENKYSSAKPFENNGFAEVVMQNGQTKYLSKSSRNDSFVDTRYTDAKAAEAAGEYAKAIALYEALDNYDDSLVRIRICREQLAEQLFKAEDYAAAREQYVLLGDEAGVASCDEGIIRLTYESACALEEAESYEEANALFEEIPDYLDTAEHIRHINGIVAFMLFDEGKFEEAKAAFETLEGYEDEIAACVEQITLAKYNEALALEAAEDYDAAVRLFDEIKDYKDAAEHIRRLNAVYAFALMEEGRYAEARDAFLAEESEEYAEQISECTYQIGLALYEAGEVEAASQELYSIKGYKDVDELFEKFEELRCEAIYQEALSYINKSRVLSEGIDCLLQIRNYKDSEELLYEKSKEYAFRLLEANALVEAAHYFKIAREIHPLNEENMERIYLYAKSRYNSRPYQKGISEICEVIPNYKDADVMKVNAMNSYVDINFKVNDMTTYQYIRKLCDANYPGALVRFLNLYSTKITNVCVNTSENDNTTDLSTFKNTDTMYVHFKVEGGPPDTMGIVVLTQKPGEKGRRMQYYDASSGDEFTYEFSLNDANIERGMAGNLTFEICFQMSKPFVSERQTLASKTVYIYP